MSPDDAVHTSSRPLHDRRAGAHHTTFLPLVLGATGDAGLVGETEAF